MKDTLKNISDESVPDIEDETTEAETPGDAEEDNLIYRLFSFRSLDEADNAAKHVNASYEGESILYKDNIKCLYFLLLSCSQKHSNDLLKVCNEITEYGHKESIVFGTSAYLNEHCDIIIKHDALSVCQTYKKGCNLQPFFYSIINDICLNLFQYLMRKRSFFMYKRF